MNNNSYLFFNNSKKKIVFLWILQVNFSFCLKWIEHIHKLQSNKHWHVYSELKNTKQIYNWQLKCLTVDRSDVVVIISNYFFFIYIKRRHFTEQIPAKTNYFYDYTVRWRCERSAICWEIFTTTRGLYGYSHTIHVNVWCCSCHNRKCNYCWYFIVLFIL